MDDARPLSLFPTRDRAAEQPVDERPAAVPRGRMYDDPGRLVDDKQMLVLVGDAEVELLRLERRQPDLRNVELELLAPLQAVALRAHSAVDEDSLLPEQAFRGRAGAHLFEPCQEPV